MDGKRVEKSTWDACSTAHISLPSRTLVAIAKIGNDKGISQSKVVQGLLLESRSLKTALDDLAAEGLFDPCETPYEEFRKKQEALKK